MISTKQSGAMLLVMMLIVVVGSMTVIVTELGQKSSIIKRDIKNTTTLTRAEEALIGWALTNSANTGELPLPDTDNDGQGNCPVVVTNSDRIGRLPWLNYPAPCSNPRSGTGMNFKDQSGETLWYAVSANLIDDGTAPVINAAMLSLTTGWLSVFDGTGALLSDRVAAVIIAPGEALPGQNRDDANSISDYLDAINSNADDQFVIDRTQENFNDRLIYITADEFLNDSVKKVVEGQGGVW